MRMYAITDRRLLAGEHQPGRLNAYELEELVRLAGEWAAAGVEFVQLREKDLRAPELTRLAREMMSAIAGRARLLVNAGSPDAERVVRAVGAAGLHLPGRWRADQVGCARASGLVSAGCHSIGEVAVARTSGADIALLSPVYPTQSHPDAPALGMEALSVACRTAGPMPVFALGGVTMENAEACIAAGAAGVAGIRTFLHVSMH
jgi:thiamine-phosphate pyrophosphorylase